MFGLPLAGFFAGLLVGVFLRLEEPGLVLAAMSGLTGFFGLSFLLKRLMKRHLPRVKVVELLNNEPRALS